MLTFVTDHWLICSVVFVLACVAVLAIYDVLQTKHQILHNFPVVGHLRYFLERIGPELRQYWVATDKEEMPFNRNERSWIYASAKGENNTFGFGTTEHLYEIGYPIIKHSAFPFPEEDATYPSDDPTAIPCIKVIGESHGRQRPYRPESIINISAMSFGSLGERAISAMNVGARDSHCFHNTGEGGISPYHRMGADLMWQIGTGYFGARGPNLRFSLDECKKVIADNDKVRCVEIKLSQGAKPGKGGILPAAKVTAKIAKIRGIPVGKDCISPNAHSEFDTVDELIDFVELVADGTGIPVGIKSAVGKIDFWHDLARRMKERSEGPDFISIDGAEGGTGAAPLTFTDHVSLPLKIGFKRVYMAFQAAGISKDIVWSGSGKLGFPDRAVIALAMGCDIIQIAREAMMAVGCIQAQRCHDGHCPTGVATQNRWLQSGLNVAAKADRFALYIKSFRKELLALSHAAGYQHPSEFSGKDIEFSSGINEFTSLEKILGYQKDPVRFESMTKLESTT